MTNGQRVITTALRYEGVREAGVNSGEPIETWQRAAEDAHGYPRGTYRRAPWCAIWVKAMFAEAGVAIDPMLTHPYTGYICDRADQLGGLAPRGLAPAGSLMIKDGVHVGLVVADRGNGLLDTIEGNSGDAVRRNVRVKSDWRIIVPPGIEDGAADRIVRQSYGFDDLTIKPATYGPWATARGRDRLMAEWAAENPHHWVVPVELDKGGSRFAFRTGPAGTYGDTWRFGGWPTKAARKRQVDAYLDRNPGASIRIWAKRIVIPASGVPFAAGTGGPTGDTKTT